MAMIGAGAILMVFGMKKKKAFMKVITRIAVFACAIVFFYIIHFFDGVDPTKLSRVNVVEGYFLAFFAVVIAFIAQYCAGILLEKFFNWGPTLIGCLAGYFVAIYLILSLNGFMSIFQVAGKDFVSPNAAFIMEFLGVAVGGGVGNRMGSAR